MKELKLHLNYAGYCFAHEHHAIRGGAKKEIKFHALWALIAHPEEGYILFDTGYTQRFFDETKSFPNLIYAKVTKVICEKEDEVIQQLERNGIRPDEIKMILISHFHADHIAGLKDFPNARLISSKKAFEHTVSTPKIMGFSKGILHGLIPKNFKDRIEFVEDIGVHKNDPFFGHYQDLFSDDSIRVYDLPGHAAGQIGIRLKTKKNHYFLIADACWIDRSYKEMVLPHPIVKLFFHSWKDFKESLSKVNQHYLNHPEEVIVPTHCSKTTDPLVSENIDWNAL